MKRNCSCRGLRVSLTLIVVLLLQLDGLFGQIGIGTTNPHPSSGLDIQSQTMGVLLPRMTATEMENIADPYNGLLVFNINLGSYCIFDSTLASPAWIILNPWVTDATLNSNLTISTTKNIGIGTSTPTVRLTVAGRVRADTMLCSNLNTGAISVSGTVNAGSVTVQDTIYATSFTGTGSVPAGTIVYWEVISDDSGVILIPDGWVELSNSKYFCTAVGASSCGTGIGDTMTTSKTYYRYEFLIKKL